MNNPSFIDTNILINAVMNDVKTPLTVHVLKNNDIIMSTQVLNEFANVMLKKNYMDINQVSRAITGFYQRFKIELVDSKVIFDALSIKNRYGYSYWDSLMVAGALNAKATILYSEDMQHQQVIDDRLTIINPFYSN